MSIVLALSTGVALMVTGVGAPLVIGALFGGSFLVFVAEAMSYASCDASQRVG